MQKQLLKKHQMNDNTRISNLVSPYVRGLSEYVPGKSLREVEAYSNIPAENIAKLASNENPLGPPQKSLENLTKALASANFYPESQCETLRKRVACEASVKPENIVLGNGSNEVIELLARTFLSPCTEAMYGDLAFIVYSMVARAVGCRENVIKLKQFTHDLDDFLDAITERTRVIFIANPNNPTGTMVQREKVERFLEAVPKNVIVVLDEAYYEYSSRDEFVEPLRWLNSDKNVIFLRTFSKFYALAGLRVGYAICSEETANWINRVREPFNVNSLAIAAAIGAMDDEEHARATLETNAVEKIRLESGYRALKLEYVPSKANFHLVNVKKNASALFMALLKKGVIVRPMDGYGLPNHLRMTVGCKKDNLMLLDSLKEILPKV